MDRSGFEGFGGNEERHGLPIFHPKHLAMPAPAAAPYVPDYEEDANGNTFLANPKPAAPPVANLPAAAARPGPRLLGPPTPAPRFTR